MTPELVAILVTAGLQTAALVALGVMVYRQGRRFTPGEAAIFLEMQTLVRKFEGERGR